MRIGIGVGEIGNIPATLDVVVDQIVQAERDGFASAWVANIFGMDALTVCALGGKATERIEIGTAVVPTFTRHPLYMAQQALTTNVACDGRFVLGIGPSHQVVVENILGLSYAKPYTHTKEYVAVLGPLLRGEVCQYEGEEYRVAGQIQFAGMRAPELMISALAPKMLALAGRECAGTITWMTGAKTISEHTAPRIQAAAKEAGRGAPRIVAGLPVCVCDSEEEARAQAAKTFAMYNGLPSYRAMLDREGGGGPESIAVVGTEDQVATQLDAFAAAGVTDFLGAPFTMGPDKAASYERTRSFLKQRAAG